ncbi:EAL domain-containing protein [Vibrio sp. JC009]|uniref:putative bifunctional diguanylate cyclase/phosphodiesterase n=1 Tax=Vibrio sp. JC009 TaxID=2912314 RepID=UPI0023AEFDF9|nr:EAL domain-containing protein [Vibrio sp. JC009]WED23121.1 EAL domain-containing protein [Vibrio sp. JC009]
MFRLSLLNPCTCFVDKDGTAAKKARTEKELRKALQNLNQFEIWYQPLVCLDSGKIFGAEALLRWRHPEQGLIPPDQFIPVAESTGMIVPIGNMLIEKLCRQLSQWKPLLSDEFHLSFNLSPVQLYRSDLSKHIQTAMEKHNISPEQLYLEITENLLIKDEEKALAVLKQLRDLGLQIWLDDFGTGYSSLAYLRRFALDGIKIDRCFIKEVTSSYKDKELVKAIIALAEKLELGVIAEGIESTQQLSCLKEFKCPNGQGYCFSRPLPGGEFQALLSDWYYNLL